MMKKPENANDVENLDVSDTSSESPEKPKEKQEPKDQPLEHSEEKDGERRIETPQFPLEEDEMPDSSEDPQEDVETVSP